MKVLYISPASHPDYLCDMIFHGLRSLLGPEVVDVKKLWYLYRQPFEAGGHSLAELPGRGFSLYGLLDELPVDRDDIEAKLGNHYFDLVIYGSIGRCQDYLNTVFDHYDGRDIVFLDGEDHDEYYGLFIGRGLYFKRELKDPMPGVHPIQFCIPREKILEGRPRKDRFLATCDPRDRSTYVFQHEADYYDDYRRSWFAVTMKKAGWDCLRHYEILANGCAPVFLDITLCPPLTMFRFPKYEASYFTNLVKACPRDFFATSRGEELYLRILGRMRSILRNQLTTEAMARYLLDTWRRGRQG